MTAADVNGDGKPDLIVANEGANTVSVLLNTTLPGAATPSFAAQQTFATGSTPISVTAADVNGDGKPDLIVANLGPARCRCCSTTCTQSPPRAARRRGRSTTLCRPRHPRRPGRRRAHQRVLRPHRDQDPDATPTKTPTRPRPIRRRRPDRRKDRDQPTPRRHRSRHIRGPQPIRRCRPTLPSQRRRPRRLVGGFMFRSASLRLARREHRRTRAISFTKARAAARRCSFTRRPSASAIPACSPPSR